MNQKMAVKIKLRYFLCILGTVLWLLGITMYGYMILSLILILITDPAFKMNPIDFIIGIGIIFGGIGFICIDGLISRKLKPKEKKNAE